MGANLSLNNHDHYFRPEATTSRPLLKFHRHEYRRLHQQNQHHRQKTNQALIGFAEFKFLPLMPRCSSIVSSISLLDSNEDDGFAMDEYHEWKSGLQRRFSFLQHCMRLLNISGGFQAGQITPPGFPSYTSTSRCMRPFTAGAKVQKKKKKQREQLYKDMNRAQQSFNIHDLISLRMSKRQIRKRRRITNENDSDDGENSTSTSSDKNLLIKGSGRDPSKENKEISQKKLFKHQRHGEQHQKFQKDDCEEGVKEEKEAEYLESENGKETQRDPAWKNDEKPHRRGLPTRCNFHSKGSQLQRIINKRIQVLEDFYCAQLYY